MDYDMPEEEEEQADDAGKEEAELQSLPPSVSSGESCESAKINCIHVIGAPEPDDIYGDLYTDQGEGGGLLHLQNSEVGTKRRPYASARPTARPTAQHPITLNIMMQNMHARS